MIWVLKMVIVVSLATGVVVGHMDPVEFGSEAECEAVGETRSRGIVGLFPGPRSSIVVGWSCDLADLTA